MDSSVLEYIRQRMDEMGYKSYHYEPVHVSVNATTTKVKAYNEFYYLISKTVPVSLVIESDTNIFNEGSAYSNFNFYGVQEFSGLIEISQAAAPIDLEFIQVVPTYIKRETEKENTSKC